MDMIFVYIVAGSQFFCNLSAFTIGKRWAKEGINSMNTIGDVRKLPTDHQYDENDSSVKLRQMLHAKNFDEYLTQYSNGRPLKKITKPVMLNATFITDKFHTEEALLRGLQENLTGDNEPLHQSPMKSYYKPKEVFTFCTSQSTRKKRGLLDTFWTARDLVGAGAQIVTKLSPEQNGILAGQATKYVGRLAKNFTSEIGHSLGNTVADLFKKSGLGLFDVVSGHIRRVGDLTGSTVGIASDITGHAIMTAGKVVDKGYNWLKFSKWEGNLGTLEHLYLGQKRPGESSQRSKIFNGNEQLYLSTEKNMQVPEHRNTDIIRNFPYNLAPHHEEKQFLTVLENKVDISTSSKDNRYVLSNLGVLNSVSEDNSVRNYPTEKGNGGAIKEVSHRSKRGLRRYYKILKGLLGAGAQLATSLTPQEYSTLAGEGLKFLGHKGGDWTKRLVHSVGNGAKTYLSNAGLECVDFVSGGVKALGTFSGKAITTTSNIVGEAIKHVGSAFNKSYQTGKSLFNIVG